MTRAAYKLTRTMRVLQGVRSKTNRPASFQGWCPCPRCCHLIVQLFSFVFCSTATFLLRTAELAICSLIVHDLVLIGSFTMREILCIHDLLAIRAFTGNKLFKYPFHLGQGLQYTYPDVESRVSGTSLSTPTTRKG